jgi:chromosome segregation and condensation protein ScpB
MTNKTELLSPESIVKVGRIKRGEKNAVGQPSKLTVEMVEAILAAIGEGLSKTEAARAVGISRQSLYNYLDENPALSAACAAVREGVRREALSALKQAGAQDWRAMESFIKLSFRGDYAPRGAQVNIQANGNALVMSEDVRMRLIELRKEILKPLGPKEPKTIEAIEVSQPSGLRAPFKPEPLPTEAELAAREKKIEEQQREQEIEAERERERESGPAPKTLLPFEQWD